jgi:hypothetical protein
MKNLLKNLLIVAVIAISPFAYSKSKAVTAQQALSCDTGNRANGFKNTCPSLAQLKKRDPAFNKAFEESRQYFKDFKDAAFSISPAGGRYLWGTARKMKYGKTLADPMTVIADSQFLYQPATGRLVGKYFNKDITPQGGHWFGNPTEEEKRILRD